MTRLGVAGPPSRPAVGTARSEMRTSGGQLSQVKPSWPHDGKPHSESGGGAGGRRQVQGLICPVPAEPPSCCPAVAPAAQLTSRIFKTSECRPAVVAGGKLFHKGERENVAYSRVTRLPDATCKTSFTERIWETIVGTEESASNSGASATRLFLLQTSSLNTPFVHNKRNKNLRSWNFCTQDPWCRIRLIGFDPRATFPSNLHGAGF